MGQAGGRKRGRGRQQFHRPAAQLLAKAHLGPARAVDAPVVEQAAAQHAVAGDAVEAQRPAARARRRRRHFVAGTANAARHAIRLHPRHPHLAPQQWPQRNPAAGALRLHRPQGVARVAMHIHAPHRYPSRPQGDAPAPLHLEPVRLEVRHPVPERGIQKQVAGHQPCRPGQDKRGQAQAQPAGQPAQAGGKRRHPRSMPQAGPRRHRET